MGKYNGAVITTAGESVIASALAGTELQWTVMRTSTTVVSTSSIKGLTSLTGVQQTANITNVSVYSNNVVQVSARFSNTGVAAEYSINTVGIYGKLAGGSETLIAVMKAVTADVMPIYDADSPSAFIFTNHLTVQDAASITMTVNDTGTATVADLELKVDKAGGDISATRAMTIGAPTAEYPEIQQGASMTVILGRVKKFLTDLRRAVVGIAINGTTMTVTDTYGTATTLQIPDTTYSNATTSAAGLMSAADKTKLNGIAAGAQVNSVTGVKGSAETTYRTGNVNLTAANIGAAATTHNHSTSGITTGTFSVARGGTGHDTLTANAILAGNTTYSLKQIETASGALYATAANGASQFGTLPIAQGGTGRTSAPSMLVNLASTSAASPLVASPRPGVTGTLPVGNGGTGATTVAGARNALGLGNTTGAVPVANGGTGATTVSAAQSNLGLKGDILSKFGTVDAASGTATNVVSVSLPTAGVYLIMARATFSANSRGSRSVRPYMGTQGYAGQTVLPLSGVETEISSFDFVYISSASTLYARAYQDSGATLSVSAWVGAYRIRT